MNEYQSALESVLAERGRQDQKWGQQDHLLPKWWPVLLEELGEFSKAVLDGDGDQMRLELTQVAAVALAMLECGDRNGWFK